MKNLSFFIVIILSTLLSSCFSSIGVRVYSFDMEQLYQSKEYRNIKQREELEHYQQLVFSNRINDYKENLSKRITKIINDFADKKAVHDNTKEKLLQKIDEFTNKRVDSFKTATNELIEVMKPLIGNDKMGTSQNYQTALGKYQTALNSINNIQTIISETVQQFIPNNNATDTIEYDILNQNLAEVKNNINDVFGTKITSDPEASFVYKAPSVYWRKCKVRFKKDNKKNPNEKLVSRKKLTRSKANVSKVFTLLANSDIAIIMDSPGNFLIKGVRVDGSTVVTSTFKTMNQAIKYFTYSYGIPTKLQPNEATERVSSTFDSINNYKRNKLVFEQDNADFNRQTQGLLNIISSQKAVFTDKNKQSNWKKSFSLINNSWDIYSQQINTTNKDSK